MNVHEYQAKGLFREFGIPVPRGELCRTVEDVRRAYAALGTGTVVVKAQIHAGGRLEGTNVERGRQLLNCRGQSGEQGFPVRAEFEVTSAFCGRGSFGLSSGFCR